jgi:hypothetical protein
MHVKIKLVSNMLFSGSSCWSRTAVDSQKQVRELFSPACNGLGLGEARSGLENSPDLSLT